MMNPNAATRRLAGAVRGIQCSPKPAAAHAHLCRRRARCCDPPLRMHKDRACVGGVADSESRSRSAAKGGKVVVVEAAAGTVGGFQPQEHLSPRRPRLRSVLLHGELQPINATNLNVLFASLASESRNARALKLPCWDCWPQQNDTGHTDSGSMPSPMPKRTPLWKPVRRWQGRKGHGFTVHEEHGNTAI